MPAIEWLAYNFPNRRSEKTLVEVTLKFTPADNFDQFQLKTMVHNVLLSNGVLTQHEAFPVQTLPDEPIGAYTSLLIQTALLFQQKAGHPVSFISVNCQLEQNQSIALMEHHHGDVGLTAVKLAIEVLSGQRTALLEPLKAFIQFALGRLVPLDTRAIIAAAHRRDIPTVLLERLPYKRQDFHELTKGECIRHNGLLMLGHGRFQHVLDGIFCLDRSSRFSDLRTDGDRRQVLLKTLGVALVTSENSESFTREYHLIVVNRQITAVIDISDNRWLAATVLDDLLIDQLLKVNGEIGLAPMLVRILTSDISLPITLAGSRVLDFVLAPELDRYPGPAEGQNEEMLAATADHILDWLFQGVGKVQMPIIAVTGTNGKTTTIRMINQILIAEGSKTGMVCSNGVYVQGQEVLEGDHGTVGGHLKVLTSKETEVAVLETHHNGILKNGFAFTWCDVAVCLNVSEEHLGAANIETVEQMAEVKRALIERARHAVVLNADNAFCLGMIDFSNAELTCLVSMQSTANELQTRLGSRKGYCCVLEIIDGEQCLVIHDDSRRIPVMSVASIPVTFNGSARFNTSNAMHAVLAAYLFGIKLEVIKTAMGAFNASYENTPGRLNVFDDLPFRVIVDFAHNPDGVQQFSEFIDAQVVTGRKILAFAAPDKRPEETIRDIGRAVAGFYDFYFCKDYEPRPRITSRKVAHILQQALLESGVKKEQTLIRTYGRQVMFEIFESCAPGDLLVVLVGQLEQYQMPVYIAEYAEELAAKGKS